MQAADLLIQAIKTLPENRISQVLDFVEFIKQQKTCVDDTTDTSWENNWLKGTTLWKYIRSTPPILALP